jgi:hypothetical protein
MSNVVGDVFGAITGNTQADAAKNAAQTAANAQIQGSQISADAQKNALNFIQQQESPYTKAGQQALGQYQGLLNGGAANFDISKLPGYQFEMQQGQQALQNSAAARGGALSGNTIQATQQFGQGLASTQFSDYMNRLLQLTNMGQNAASGVASSGANLIAGAGQTLGQGIAGAGASQASGIQAAGNANANAWGGLINAGISAATGGVFNGGQAALSRIFGNNSNNGSGALGTAAPDYMTTSGGYGYASPL